MKKVKAFVERGHDGTFSVYVDLNSKSLNYGIHGVGNSVKCAIDDFNSAYFTMQEFHKKMGKPFIEATFEYHYDTASFLQFYTKYFSLAGLSHLTGINKGQLSHYLNGQRNPSKKTIEKIDTSIQLFAKQISQVQLVR